MGNTEQFILDGNIEHMLGFNAFALWVDIVHDLAPNGETINVGCLLNLSKLHGIAYLEELVDSGCLFSEDGVTWHTTNIVP